MITEEIMQDYKKKKDLLEFKTRKQILYHVWVYLYYKQEAYKDKDTKDAIDIIRWRWQYQHHSVQGF